jgi:hypothetical protein
MGTPEGLPRRRQQRAFTVVVYLVLLALGVAQGLVGSFQYARSPVPLVAVILDVLIFATCLLCGLGMQSFAGGVVPAIGWFAAVFVLSIPRPNGSVIIAASMAGEWFLYGGALAAAAGSSAAFVLRARGHSQQRR